MPVRVLKLEDLGDRFLVDTLRTVVDESTTLIVSFPDGKEVVISPKSDLQPLPELEGTVPEDWKDVVYGKE